MKDVLNSYVIEMFLNLNSKGMKNLNFSPEGPTPSKIFRNEIFFIAVYENVQKFVFDWLAAKLWLKESTIL